MYLIECFPCSQSYLGHYLRRPLTASSSNVQKALLSEWFGMTTPFPFLWRVRKIKKNVLKYCERNKIGKTERLAAIQSCFILDTSRVSQINLPSVFWREYFCEIANLKLCAILDTVLIYFLHFAVSNVWQTCTWWFLFHNSRFSNSTRGISLIQRSIRDIFQTTGSPILERFLLKTQCAGYF